MSNIKRLKVTFIDKDTMLAIEDIHRIIVRVSSVNNELIAEHYRGGVFLPKEVEIKVEENLDA